jgi:NADPH-dependent curcumin reductase CurA
MLSFLYLLGSSKIAADPTNSQWILVNPPSKDEEVDHGAFARVEVPFPDPSKLEPGEVLFHLDFATVDASNRIWISKGFKETAKEEGLSFFLPFAKDNKDPMMTYAGVMTVIASNDEGFAKGDVAVGMTILQEYIALKVAEVPFGVNKVEPQDAFPNSYFLGPFGFSTGLTAWTSIMNIQTRVADNGETTDLKPGDKVFVSAGSGAVGLMATQIYKSMGADVIASTGSDEKVQFLREELGIEAFNYKTSDIDAKLAEFAPEGLQYYYDNVGGPTLDAAIRGMGPRGLIIACGMVSQYGHDSYGVKELLMLVGKELKIQGFLAPSFAYDFGRALDGIGKLMGEGKITWKEARFEWEKFPESLQGLLSGTKFGKTILVGSEIPSSLLARQEL